VTFFFDCTADLVGQLNGNGQREECYRLTHHLSKISVYATDSRLAYFTTNTKTRSPKKPGDRFTKYLMTILRLSDDSAKVTMDMHCNFICVLPDVIIKTFSQSASSFLCLCYILRAVTAGRCRERRYADHIFIQIYFRMHHIIVKFSKFSSAQAARGIDPQGRLNQWAHWARVQGPRVFFGHLTDV